MVGQWGYNVMENDIALDVQNRIEEMKKDGFSLHESTCKILSRYENLETSEIVLAVAQLEFDEYGHVKHMNETINALNSELKEEVLSTWGNTEKRKQALLVFASNVKIKL